MPPTGGTRWHSSHSSSIWGLGLRRPRLPPRPLLLRPQPPSPRQLFRLPAKRPRPHQQPLPPKLQPLPQPQPQRRPKEQKRPSILARRLPDCPVPEATMLQRQHLLRPRRVLLSKRPQGRHSILVLLWRVFRRRLLPLPLPPQSARKRRRMKRFSSTWVLFSNPRELLSKLS